VGNLDHEKLATTSYVCHLSFHIVDKFPHDISVKGTWQRDCYTWFLQEWTPEPLLGRHFRGSMYDFVLLIMVESRWYALFTLGICNSPNIYNARSIFCLLKIVYFRKSMLSVSFVARRRCFAYGLALSHFLWLSVSFTKVLKIRKSPWRKTLFSLLSETNRFSLSLLSFHFLFFSFRFLNFISLTFFGKIELWNKLLMWRGDIIVPPLTPLLVTFYIFKRHDKPLSATGLFLTIGAIKWQPGAAWAGAGASILASID
jgi:hypothetical protein